MHTEESLVMGIRPVVCNAQLEWLVPNMAKGGRSAVGVWAGILPLPSLRSLSWLQVQFQDSSRGEGV